METDNEYVKSQSDERIIVIIQAKWRISIYVDRLVEEWNYLSILLV